MKKFLALLVVSVLLVFAFTSCGLFKPEEKPCEHVDANTDYLCDNCGAELEKGPEEQPPHEHSFVEGKCECGETDPNYKPEPEKVLVNNIIVSTDDEDGEGTRENPFKVNLAQGNSIELSYAVQPKDASDNTLTWSIIDEGKGLTFSDTGSKLTITAANDATSALVEGKANDGSGVAVYLSVIIEVYTPVTDITSSGLLADDEYDYILVTALGTKWDMSGDILARGQDLLDGKIFGGSQAPRNITYWPALQNLGILVGPENATNPAIVVSYSDDSIVKVDIDGSWTALNAGETVVTIASYTEPDVKINVKVIVKDTLYRGILLEDYQNAVISGLTSWDLDADHNTEAQFARYDDWHLVMIHSNEVRGSAEIDNNQKIFYMGQADRPYGICLENNVGANSGGSLTDAASLTWAKLTIPETAVTFNVKIGNNDKVHGQYRVLFVEEDGTTTILTNDWIGFTSGPSESTQKLVLPEAIKGKTGAMVIEHRVTEYDNNAELQIKVMKFEGFVPVTSVVLNKVEGIYKPGQSFQITGQVKPDNATNDKLIFSVAAESAGFGVEVDANGNVTIAETTVGGVYYINVASAENADIVAQYKLIVTSGEIAVNKWDGKSEILNGVQGVKWEIVGETDAGVGEGADLKVTGDNTWSSLKLEYREIGSTNYVLTFGARVFHRDGETYPKFVVKVNGEIIRGAGQSEDWFYVDTDATQYCSYDLSDYIGKMVTVEIGITQGTHAVVQYIEFTGSEYNNWSDKSELQDANRDPWAHNGDVDAGVGEGYDIKGEGSYLYHDFVIGKEYNSQLTFGGRVFHRDGETYPEIRLVVVDAAGVEHIITAKGAENDYVYFDQDATSYFTYDLSAFAGQKVQVRLVLKNAATHCVIQSISMKRATPLVDKVNKWEGKDQILNGVEDVKWTIVGETDAGVGEGADLKVTGENTWSSLKLEGKTITSSTFILKFGARVFHRDGETYPHFVIKINGETVRGIGQSEDWFYVDTDDTQYCSYDLSKYLGQKVTIEIGITQGTHAVVQHIEFYGTDALTSWADKAALLDSEGDPWAHNGDCDAGVGEGYDIRGEGSYIYNSFVIGENYNSQFTFGGRVFHRDGETYPEVRLVVVDEAGAEYIITANGAENDYVYFDQDATSYFTYDLSAFAGQTVEVRLVLKNAATHCVFQSITMAGATAE